MQRIVTCEEVYEMRNGKIPQWLKLDREARRKVELVNSTRYSPSVVHKTGKKDEEDRKSNTVKPHEVEE